jgi:ribosome maturation factor RimP
VAKQNVAATVTDLLQPIFKESEVELVEVTYTKEGNEWYLRVFIDKPGGVDIEDCQNISRIIDPLLDEKDPVPHHYTLEVSSPGLERPLKKPDDYERFRDRLANITTYVPIEGKKNFKGYLSPCSYSSPGICSEGVKIASVFPSSINTFFCSTLWTTPVIMSPSRLANSS